MNFELEKVKTYIGFAEKSKNIVCGQDNLLKNKSVRLIIYSDELSESTVSKLKSFSAKYNIHFLALSEEELKFVYSKSGVKVFGIKEPNLANAIIKILLTKN